MTDFYTVHMVRKQIVSTFDTKGRKIGDRTIDLPQVFHDLPHATAVSYAKQFPDAQVRLERQNGMSGAGPSVGHTSSYQNGSAGSRKTTKPKSAPTSVGISAGTYGGLVGTMGGR